MKIDKLASDRNVKLVAHIPETTMDELQLYKSCYADKYGVPISDSKLLGAVLQQFMNEDADFAKWKRQARATPRVLETRNADRAGSVEATPPASESNGPDVADPGF